MLTPRQNKVYDQITDDQHNQERQSIVTDKLKLINEQREEILTAFVAKYGFDPDEVEQVYQTTSDGMIWFVRKRAPNETAG